MRSYLKILTVFLALLLSFVLASCSSQNGKDVSTSGTVKETETANGSESKTNETEAPVTTQITEKEAEPVKFDLSEDEISLYDNPIKSIVKTTWQNYGTGDPFIMRYNGRYYLYNSTKDSETGIKCWSSKDLVEFTYEGLCTTEPVTKAAYAPEVTYYNGKFYMYTSPAGNGHYCLVSDSPTGPFVLASGNQGRSIDGHVFIDKDGKWYFYSAGTPIPSYEMQSPTNIASSGVGTGAIINNGWTEGPMVICHDGFYYLTYTGNHVLNKAYRIYYGTSAKNPINFSASTKNPLIVSTTENITGIGHSSTVKGPDLDSYYLIYHSLTGTMPNRELNIDRLVFNGKTMYVLGPTVNDTEACPLPDIVSFFEDEASLSVFETSGKIENGKFVLKGGKAISKESLPSDKYTIELSVLEIKEGLAGVIFGYSDDNNYGSALFDKNNQKLVIRFVCNANVREEKVDLVKSFGEDYDFSALQAIEVEKNKNVFTFYVNDRELCTFECDGLTGGKVGITSEGEASFGYIGAVDEVAGSSNDQYYKQATSQGGKILAKHCTEEDVVLDVDTKTKEASVVASAGTSLNYRILAESDGTYDFSSLYYSENGAEITLYFDGKEAGKLSLKGNSSKFITEVLRSNPLTKGKHVMTVYVNSGDVLFKEFDLVYANEVTGFEADYSKGIDGYSYRDGTHWKSGDGVLEASGVGKRLYGDYTWGDYVVEFDVTSTSNTAGFGILLHTQNPGETNLISGSGKNMTTNTSDESAAAGADWMQGYYIEFTGRTVTLKKCNYNSQNKNEGSGKITKGEKAHIKAVCEGANIKVYVDGELAIDWTDPEPFLNGMAGLRIAKGSAQFENFKIYKLEK